MNIWSLLLPFKWFVIGVGEVGLLFLNLVKGVFSFALSLFKYLFKGVILIGRGAYFLLKVIIFEHIILSAFKALKLLIIYIYKGLAIILKSVLIVGKNIFIYLYKGLRILFVSIFKGLKISIIYIYKGIKVFVIYIYKFLKWLLGDILFKSIKFIFTTLLNGIIEMFKLLIRIPLILWNGLKKLGKKIYESVVSILNKIGTKIKSGVISLFKGMAKFFQRISTSLKRMIENLKKGINKWFNNLSLVKDARNKREMKRQALLIDFDAEDAARSEKKVMYHYVGKNSNEKIEKGYLSAYSKLDVHSYLLAEGYEVYQIEVAKGFKLSMFSIKHKMKVSELVFFLTQLSTYIKSGIPLVDSVKILSKQTKKASVQTLYKAIIYDLTMGDNFSEALEKQGDSFPKLLINMVKSAELSGNLSETLDDMAEYYSSVSKTRKQMKSAMTYPTVIFIFAMTVVVFLLVFVIPSFVDMYRDADAEVPTLTLTIIAISDFLINNALLLILGFVGLIVGFYFMYKNVKLFRSIMQWILMHTPIVGKIIIYNEVTMFSKTFASLWNHNVFITSSMEILSKITNNEIYKMLIFDAITNIARGEPVSSSFKNHWAFPIVAYEMLVTGERTGQPGPMMGKVADYYQEEHKNAVNQVKTFIEPAMIVFLAVVVGAILLSVVLPMFGIYGEMGLE
ncbi:MAG TPA: type II secretion system F family protein [Mollicutes bacterium]|nr:type II secretion system F family protein [Mollicutes bacterium]